MNWQSLLAIQKTLDDRILNEHDLSGQDLVPQKLLALQVELCELANETRCFKYWSKKPPASREVILGEYVDVVHFVLSLLITFDVTDIDGGQRAEQSDLTAHFSYMLGLAHQIAVSRNQDDLRELFTALVSLGELLCFSEAEVEQAYLYKNSVNHQRQEQGY